MTAKTPTWANAEPGATLSTIFGRRVPCVSIARAPREGPDSTGGYMADLATSKQATPAKVGLWFSTTTGAVLPVVLDDQNRHRHDGVR
jgi:hypothetical protein